MTCTHTKKKPSAELKGLQKTNNFNGTFTDTILGIKKIHTAIKIIFTIKAKNEDYHSHS